MINLDNACTINIMFAQNWIRTRAIYPVLLLACLAGSWWLSNYSYTLFHTIVEIFCVVIAAVIFILVWNSRSTLTSGSLLVVGAGQLFMALFDIIHTLAYKGVQMFPGFDSDLPTQFWIASRYYLVFSLLSSFVFIKRKVRFWNAWLVYFGVFLLLVGMIFSGVFPQSFIEGSGLTPFKIYSEYVLIGLFLIVLALLVVNRANFDPTVFRWLLIFIVANVISEFLFTLYSSVTDAYNLLGHVTKLTAYFALYKAIVEVGLIRPYALLFLELKQSEQALRRSNEELQTAYDRLAQTNLTLIETSKKRLSAEKELEQYAARLEQSNRDLEQFAFVASHDLQEPLRKIRLFGERLKESPAVESLDPDSRDFLERMVQASERMRLMIGDLLELSRLTTGRTTIEPVDLDQMLAEVVSDLEVRLARSKGRVEVGPLPTIDADPLQLRRLFQNLIGNALKFSRPGVPPVVRVNSAPVERKEREMVAIEILDNGIGFDPQYAGVIFEPFKRLHGRSEYEGNGMGLAICRKIAEHHNGQIEASSRPGEGSTFTVYLPCTISSKIREN